MILGKDRLTHIDDLNVKSKLDEWSDDETADYSSRVLSFVDEFVIMEAEFKKALFMDNKDTLAKTLSQLSKALKEIRADDLANQCDAIMENEKGVEAEKFEADMLGLLSAVATLSIDIQMEQYRAEMSIKAKTRKLLAVDIDKPKNILAVDDISVTLNVLKNVLSEDNYKLYGVTSGAAALDFITKITPDLFILDIEMPQMSGFELAQKLRDAGETAPIIFLTGNTMREHLIKAVKAGAIDFLVKPIDPAHVKTKVKKVFEPV